MRSCALVRQPEAAASAAACGADVRRADIFDCESLRAALHGCEIGVNLATSLPGPKGRASDYGPNDELRRLGTPIWVEACRDAGVARVLQQSIALVNSGGGDEWADEDTTFAPDDTPAGHAIAACLAMEGTVRSSALDWIILRGGFFYGPGTGYDDAWFAAARAGELRLPDDGSSYISLVHIADMAEATVRAISQWPSEQVLIVADDAPARWGDVLAWVAALAGGPSPQPGGRIGLPSYRVRNDRAREVPGWAPFYFLPRWASALTSLDYDRTARRPGGPSSPNTRGRDGAVSRLRWR